MAGIFIRAVITGFGFSLGKAIYDEVHKRLEKYRKNGDGEAKDAGAKGDIDPPPDLQRAGTGGAAPAVAAS